MLISVPELTDRCKNVVCTRHLKVHVCDNRCTCDRYMLQVFALSISQQEHSSDKREISGDKCVDDQGMGYTN